MRHFSNSPGIRRGNDCLEHPTDRLQQVRSEALRAIVAGVGVADRCDSVYPTRDVPNTTINRRTTHEIKSLDLT